MKNNLGVGGGQADARNRKGEGSLFASNGYWYFTYGYTIDGERRKKKKCLGSIDVLPTEEAARREAEKVKKRFVAAVLTGKVATSSVENVECGELLDQYVKHLQLKGKPSAYVIEKCIDASLRPYFGSRKVASLRHHDFERYRETRVSRDDVSNATVDHDLTYLRAALNLEHRKKPHTRVPVVHVHLSRHKV